MLLVAAAGTYAGLSLGRAAPPTASGTAGTADGRLPARIAPWALVATVSAATPVYGAAGGRQRTVIPATWFGAPSALPVLSRTPGWLEVRIAQRPNGQVGWIHQEAARLTRTPFHLVIDLRTTHLQLYQQGRLAMDAPVGIGTPRYPTPTGHYFVALFARSPNPGYGPFVMVTSAHSETITDWEQSGDAIVAIHGPLGSDQEIGTTGAAVSHGCIRLHDADLARLAWCPTAHPSTSSTPSHCAGHAPAVPTPSRAPTGRRLARHWPPARRPPGQDRVPA